MSPNQPILLAHKNKLTLSTRSINTSIHPQTHLIPTIPYHHPFSCSDEFNQQVATEQALSMPVLNFMMTPDDKALCKNEIGFATFVVAPMWRSLAGLFPGTIVVTQQSYALNHTVIHLHAVIHLLVVTQSYTYRSHTRTRSHTVIQYTHSLTITHSHTITRSQSVLRIHTHIHILLSHPCTNTYFHEHPLSYAGLKPLVEQLDSNLQNWKQMLERIVKEGT